MNQGSGHLPEATYTELVASLASTLLPTMIMTACFAGVGLIVTRDAHDDALLAITIAGSLAALCRLAILLLHRKRLTDDGLTVADARHFERRYTIAYFSFALMLGAFGARGFLVASPAAHMLIVGLLFGYGAGVAAGLSLRPWISVPSVLVAIVPTVIVALSCSDLIYRGAGILLALFLGGGVQSMLLRYRLTAQQVTMRRLFATLARSDHLTSLPNRLSLRERFQDAVQASGGQGMIAVHCLDLDRFKPVNDRYGHPAGDALLKAVSGRLQALLRHNDFAARLGGDEFVVVQTNLAHAGEAELLARRIARAIAQPYSIEEHEVVIGTSIGYALSTTGGHDLDRLMAQADQALCAIKRAGGGIAPYRNDLAEREIRLRA
ncbi:MAG: GGDEF domain-containing protein [Sphingomonas sp.]|uniref:diguanylate cyclase domain-containing protein n=1 Tax=Sphingomonas sp. TaxID=28214 RepID=UPI003568C761